MAEITRGEYIVLQLLKAKPSRFRILYPLLTSEKAKLAALKIRKETRERDGQI